MKTKYLNVLSLSLAAGGLGLLSGCVVEPNGRMAFQPFVVVATPPVVYAAPAPVEVAPVMVPDSYAWDGYEYVGLVGDQYYYLGPGNVWLFCDPLRLGRFHGWEGAHRDWRDHAIRNDRYRTDRNGHVQPRRDVRQGKDRKNDH
jgi:hypothetical protein